MQHLSKELESSDESDDWETLPEVGADGCLVISDWLRLNSGSSSTLAYTTNESTDSEQSTFTEDALDQEKANQVETTSAEQSHCENNEVHNEDEELMTQTATDNRAMLLQSVEDEADDGKILLSDDTELGEEANVAWMLRHFHLSSFAWRSVPGIVCVLSIAIFGISHYIYIHQTGNYSNIHAMPPQRDRGHRSITHDVCRWTNASFIGSPGSNRLPEVNENSDSQVPATVAYCTKLESMYISARKQNDQLKQVVSRLQKRLMRMSNVADGLQLQHLTLMRSIRFTEHNSNRAANSDHFPKSDQSSMTLESGVDAAESLNVSIERLQSLVRRLEVVTTKSEQMTSEKLLKRMQKIAVVLSNAVKSFIKTVDRNFRKVNRHRISSTVLRASAELKNSLTDRNHEKIDVSNPVDGIKRIVLKQQKKKRKSKKKMPQSNTSGGNEAPYCNSEVDSKMNWLFDAYEQREALRGMPYIGDTQNPSWLIRRWNKRGSLRQQYS